MDLTFILHVVANLNEHLLFLDNKLEYTSVITCTDEVLKGPEKMS